MLSWCCNMAFVIFVIILQFYTFGYVHASNTRTIHGIHHFAETVRQCFVEHLKNDLRYFRETSLSEIYLSEKLFELFEDPSIKLDQKSAIAICKSSLVPDYIRAYEETTKELLEQKSKTPDLAKISQNIELNDKFLQITGNLLLDHSVTGHAELTEFALLKIPGNIQLSKEARKLVIAASQLPDLYRWDDERYHGITCMHPNLKSRKCDPIHSDSGKPLYQLVDESQDLFINLIQELLHRVVTRLNQKDFQSALFWLGVSCHPLQDLAFHQGITTRQHAGLSYVLSKDPDNAKGVIGNSKKVLATKYCRQFIEAALEKTTTNLAHLNAWITQGQESLSEIASREFGNPTNMTTRALIDYWLLSRYYKRDKSRMRELLVGGGLAVWDLRKISERLESIYGAK